MSVRKEFQSFTLNEQGAAAAQAIAESYVGGRELSLAITHMQTAKMFAVNGLAQSNRSTTD